MTRTTRWLWFALLILLPLVHNPWSRWQYEPDKVALLLVLAGLVTASTLWHGELRRVKPSLAERGIVLFLVIRWLSLIGSITPAQSLWGDPAWRNGWWTLLVGVGLFILARRQFSASAERAKAINALLIGSALVAGYGVFEYLNPFDHRQVVRTDSTQGHPTLLAGYLVMVLPFTLSRMVSGPRRIWFAGLWGLQSACLLFTYARAGWLAALVGSAVWSGAWLWLAGRRRMVAVLGTLMIAAFVTLFVLSLLPPLPGSAPHWLQTATSLFRWTGATARIRLLGWEASLDAIHARPWLGYGPATFRHVLEWHMPPALAPFGGSPALGGRMHNIYLEIALESGLIGLFVYCAMVGVVMFPLMHELIREGHGQNYPTRHQLLQVAVLAALVANLVNGLFSFDTATTVLLFWVLAGTAHAQSTPSPALTCRRQPWAWGIAALSMVVAGFIVIPDMIMYRGEQAAVNGHSQAALNHAERAVQLAPTPGVYRVVWAYMLADQATETDDDHAWQAGANILEQLVEQQDTVAEYHERYGLYMRRWYMARRIPELARQAIDAYSWALELSPRDPDLWLDRGLVRLEIGEECKAVADFEQANRLLADYPRYFGAMALYALAHNDHQAAAEWNARALAAQQAWEDWVWRR